jgi:hypothetical protein
LDVHCPRLRINKHGKFWSEEKQGESLKNPNDVKTGFRVDKKILEYELRALKRRDLFDDRDYLNNAESEQLIDGICPNLGADQNHRHLAARELGPAWCREKSINLRGGGNFPLKDVSSKVVTADSLYSNLTLGA